MNKQIKSSHTENALHCNNGMEQAALVRARVAVARLRRLEGLVPPSGRGRSAKERWYAALENDLCGWIERGGFAQEDGGSRERTAESTYIE